jgi:sec-independent protein translocase protein TatA
MPFNLGPVELGLILLIVAMLFGVGKLPEVFGSIGKGVREFRKESGMNEGNNAAQQPQVLPPQQAPVAQLPVAPVEQVPVAQAPVAQVPVTQAPVAESNPVTTE